MLKMEKTASKLSIPNVAQEHCSYFNSLHQVQCPVNVQF